MKVKVKMEQSPAINPNPVLSVAKDGTVLYSNDAGEPLLHEWNVKVGEKLPSHIGNFVQNVITRNSTEKIKVKVGKKVYLFVCHPLLEQECVCISGFDISDQKDFKEKVQESEIQKMANVELAEIIDIQTVQSLIDDFYKLVHIPCGLDDLKGNVLVGAGWQDICSKFHRVHPETRKQCIESNMKLSSGVPHGEFKLHKCKNNMWDMATPFMAGDQHVGNIFAGQFFFEDEPLDYELFRSQARKYSFNEEEYITALEKVPRLSREAVNTGMSFFMTFANMLSHLNYSNVKLAKSLAERDLLVEALSESEEKYRNIVETANEGICLINIDAIVTYANRKAAEMLGYTLEEMIGRSAWDLISEECKPLTKLNLEKRYQDVNESYELKLIRKDGSPIWVNMSARANLSSDGKFMGSLSMFTDITMRKEAEDALANIETARQKEIHHRIKNNLQVISSLLDLQTEQFKGRKNIKDSEVLDAFRESQDRVIAMAFIHEELHKGGENNSLNFSQYIEKLADNLFLTYRLGNAGTSLDTDVEKDIFFDIDTSIPLGIITNELVSNSLKYAFVDRDKGEIRIGLHREENGEYKSNGCKSANYVLIISDNGVGIPKDIKIEELESLGLQLVTSLVDQLDGKLELKRDNGTEFTIKFTVTEKSEQASAPAL